ncbi:MAG: TetR/AcrR family transcriptional regulator [Acidimicrobiia bacterium]
MRNSVLDATSGGSVADDLAARAVDERRAAYADEVRRLIDAAYSVMRETGDIEPRVGDVVRTAGLSNQAFYRHFKSKDALLLAVLTDGRHRMMQTLAARMERVDDGAPRIAAWIEGVLAQARNADAAANTRPFVVNGLRIADRFPTEWNASRDALLAPLRAAVTAAGGDPERDPDALYNLAFGAMESALIRRVTPTRDDVEHLVEFGLRGVQDRPETARSPRTRSGTTN